MKTIKILITFCIVVGAAFILYVFFAGVNLILENQSGQTIHKVEINYGKGTVSADSITNKDFLKKSLGKIGEGATFDVQWRDNTGINQQAQFSVYFFSHSGYDTVRIKFLPRGAAVLYEGERLYKPNSLNHSSP